MGAKYNSQTVTGYNAVPPPDDGSAVAGNEITWAKHKTKLADPILTLVQAINTALLDHVDETVVDVASNTTTNAGHHKRTINVTGAFTVSLGDAMTMAIGYIVIVKNSHTAAITVDLATGTDTLDGTVAGSVSLEAGAVAMFITNATADGYYTIGSVMGNNLTVANNLIVSNDLSVVNDLTVSGLIALEAFSEDADSYTVTTGTKALDTAVATYFYPTGAMTAVAYTFQFDNLAATGRVTSFTLEMNNPAAASSITWPAGVKWPDGIEPTWSAGIDILSFVTRDGGTTINAFLGGVDFS